MLAANRLTVFGLWVLVTALGEALGSFASTVFGANMPAVVPHMQPWMSHLLVLGGGAIEGGLLGAVQVPIVARLHPELAPWKWVLATLVGMTAGWLFGTLVNEPSTAESHPLQIVGLGIAVGLVLGATIGMAQAVVLRAHRPARSWIIASSLGWGAGLVVTFVGNATIPAGEWTGFLFAQVALTAGATGATVGAITGVDLVLRPDSRTPARARPN